MPIPTASSVSNPQAKGYGARINDLLLRLAVAPDNDIQLISTADDEPLRLDTAANPEDYSPDHGRVYSLVDLSGGENLAFAHRRNATPTDPIRYWRSKGIAVAPAEPGEIPEFRLAHQLDQAFTHTSTNTLMCRNPNTDDSVFYASGSQLYRVEGLIAGSPTRNSEDPSAGTENITGLAVIGDKVYAAAGSDGIEQRSSAGSWSSLNTDTVGRIWAAKLRLLAGIGANLSEVDLSTGTATAVINGASGTSFVDVVEAGPVVLAANSDGTIFSLGIDDSANLVVLSQMRTPVGETPTMLAYSSGKVLVGTTAMSDDGQVIGRLYDADVGDANQSYVLTGMQLLRTWEGNVAAPQGATVTRDSIWFLVDDGTETQVWRYLLTTRGVMLDLYESTAGAGRSLTLIYDRAVVGIDGVGLYAESDLYESTGYVISPAIDFFTSSTKVWESLIVNGTVGTGRIRVSVSSDLDALNDPSHVSWLQVASLSVDSTGMPLSIRDLTASRWLIVKIDLDSTSPYTVSPVVQSISVRAFPQGTDIIVRVPVNVSDRIERPNRKPIRVAGWGRNIHAELHNLRGRAVELEIYRDQLTVVGKLLGITQPQRGRGRTGYPGERAYVEVRGRILQSGVFGGGSYASPGTRGIDTRGLVTRGT